MAATVPTLCFLDTTLFAEFTNHGITPFLDRPSLYWVSCQLTIDVVASLDHSQLVHDL